MAKERSKQVDVEVLEASFKEKNFLPLYLFSGEEDFLIDEALDLLVRHAVDESTRSFNLDILYGGDVDARDVVTRASSFPMMADRRVVIVREADKLTSSDSNREILLRYVGNPSPTTILVLVLPKADLRLAVFKAFQQNGAVIEYGRLYEEKIPAWVSKRVKAMGRRITEEACQLMPMYVGTSLRDIQNEIEKLLIYVGDKRIIEADDVTAVAGMSKQFNVFELQKAIGQRNLSRSMNILDRMLDAGEHPVGIVTMLTRYFQKLWVLPSLRRQSLARYELASQLSVNPFFLREYVAAAERFSAEEIERSFAALIEADETLKSSGEPKLVMTMLIHRLIRPVEEYHLR